MVSVGFDRSQDLRRESASIFANHLREMIERRDNVAGVGVMNLGGGYDQALTEF